MDLGASRRFVIPGSWLEISQLSTDLLDLLARQTHIERIILKETAMPAPTFPFMILVDHLDALPRSEWRQSPLFCGFLWRTSELKPGQWASQPQVWVDYIVQDVKSALSSLVSENIVSQDRLFLSASPQLSPRKMSALLQKLDWQPPLRPLDWAMNSFQNWEELEKFEDPILELNPLKHCDFSIIIPHYENPYFLCNVLKHIAQIPSSPSFEVLIMDDTSSLKTRRALEYFLLRHTPALSVRLFCWKERKNLFRAGASRNWGATMARGETLLFLDSDMLVPPNVLHQLSRSLEHHDVVQFVRKHIPVEKSHELTSYSELVESSSLYFEEGSYWGPLYEGRNWTELPDYWKYTCTYALGLRRSLFFDVGRIRRSFIQYGFEDTDLGYRLWKKGARFYLNKTPLLHLTANRDESQGLLYRIKKIERLKPMARAFFHLNLDSTLYRKFQSLLD